MTVRTWNRNTITGTSSPGHPDPYNHDSYNQNGSNASPAERQAGIYADHIYIMNRSRYTQPASSIRIWWDTTTSKTNVSEFGAWASFGSVPPPDLAKAVSKLLEKWRNSTFNAGVSVGEGKESVEMIISNLKAISDAARELRRRNFGGALAALAKVPKGAKRKAYTAMTGGYLANAWLELQYGWKPLINDIYAAADFVKLKPKTGVIRSSSKETSDICLGISDYPASDVKLKVNERRRHLKVTTTSAPNVFERLGLTDPATIAWELVPFSFVADWFFPIGTLLEALHATQVMPVVSCCDTYVDNRYATLPVHAGQRYGAWVCTQSAQAIFDQIKVERYVSSSLPSNWAIIGNALARSITNEKDPILDHLANAAALARSQVGRLGVSKLL
jgi:hypothetical protein